MTKGFTDTLTRIIAGKSPEAFLKPGKLMEAWYCLKTDHVTAVVDSVRPRVFRLYTHGKFGSFQNLIYDTDAWGEVTGICGIVPWYEVEKERAFPFVPFAYCYENFGRGKTQYDPDRQAVSIRGVPCYLEKQLGREVWSPQVLNGYDWDRNRRPPLDFSVRLAEDELVVTVSYPAGVERNVMGINLYPLYTHYVPESGEKHWIEYMRCGLEGDYVPSFENVMGHRLVLEDRLCRLPRLTVSSRAGACRLISHTDWERNNAARLELQVETTQSHLDVTLRLEANPVTLRVDPLVGADRSASLTISTPRTGVCKVDGVPRSAKSVSQGHAQLAMTFSEGAHEITVETPAGFAKRTVYAVDVGLDKIAALADALMRLFWRDGEKKDIIAYAFHPDTLEPLCREGACFIVHAIRALTTLFLGARALGRPEYVEQGYRCLKALVGRAHSLDQGELLLPIWLDMEGRPNAKTLDACRPSDLGIMIRGFLYAARVFHHFGLPEKRRECLDLALRFARTFLRMQRDDGAFYSRYSFPDLRPTSDRVGTVNNWMIQVWHLADELAAHRLEASVMLRKIVTDYVDFGLFKRRPSILEVVGGADEGPANYHDDLATTAACLAIKYASDGDAKYKRYAEQAFQMSFFCRNHRLDSPYDYMYPLTPHMGPFYDFPCGLGGKGDMTDLAGNEVGLFLKDLLDFEFGEYVAAYSTAGMFTDSYNPNGALYAINVHVPNYTHVMRNYSDVNVYGGLGVTLFWLFDHYLNGLGGEDGRHG